MRNQNRPRYWSEVFSRTREELGLIELVAEMGGGMIAVFLAWGLRFVQKSELRELVFLGLAGGIGGAVFGFVFRFLFITPAKMYRELEEENQEKEIQIKNLLIQKCDLQIEPILKYGTGRDTRYDISVLNEGPSATDGVELRVETVSFIPLGKPLEIKDISKCLYKSSGDSEILPKNNNRWYFLHYNNEISILNPNKVPAWEFDTVQPYVIPPYNPCQNNEYEVLVSVNAKNTLAKKQVKFKLNLLKNNEISVERIEDEQE